MSEMSARMASMGDPVVLIYDEQCAAYAASGHPERPQRVLSSAARLREQTKISFEWHAPRLAPREAILRAHRLAHHDAVATQKHAFDEDTPSHEGIYHHALRAAGGAMDAMTHATGGMKAFSLLRPPGHHATPERAMGFCYLFLGIKPIWQNRMVTCFVVLSLLCIKACKI